jgi:hypothetical protein
MSERVCACGCGGSLAGRRAGARYLDVACRVRAHRRRKRLVLVQGHGEADVTVSGPPAKLRIAA